MAEEEEKPIRVVDRRMFTPEGELRPDFHPEEPESAAPPAKPGQTAPPREPDAAGGQPREQGSAPPVEGSLPPEDQAQPREPRTAFGSLVGWIATNSYAALGLLPDEAGRSHRDLTVARQMIDWLAVLEQKTRGNLSFEETDFLSRALYELRLAFVEMSRRPTK
jgi:hypothetical protein